MDTFHQGGKYSLQISRDQVDLRREVNFTNVDSISGCGKNSERENTVQKKCIFLEVPTIMQKSVSKG